MKKKVLSMILVVGLVLSFATLGMAAPGNQQGNVSPQDITLEDVMSRVPDNANIVDIGINKDGIPFVITDDITPLMTRSGPQGSLRHHVTAYCGAINCSYDVLVMSNQLVWANDWWIATIFGTYSNVNLTCNSKKAELTFDYTGYTGIGMMRCWVRAVPTGRDNAIKVTHS